MGYADGFYKKKGVFTSSNGRGDAYGTYFWSQTDYKKWNGKTTKEFLSESSDESLKEHKITTKYYFQGKMTTKTVFQKKLKKAVGSTKLTKLDKAKKYKNTAANRKKYLK